jgi:hypothetical protein
MSLFELMGETRDPGPVGSAEGGPPSPGGGGPRAIVFRGILAISIVVGVIAVIVTRLQGATDRIVVGLAVTIYGLLAYRITVRPRLDNVGWARGFIDHPFRWSDDVNRWLVFFGMLLAPGRFVTTSIRDLVRYSRGERVMVFPRNE